jgi:2-methylisocitrate lyase-like PEP mutase family enzyme
MPNDVRKLPSQDDQYRRATAFRDLHEGTGAFVVPDPWDAGTARLLTAAGFDHLHGRPDLAGTIRRLQAYEQAGDDSVDPHYFGIRGSCTDDGAPGPASRDHRGS